MADNLLTLTHLLSATPFRDIVASPPGRPAKRPFLGLLAEKATAAQADVGGRGGAQPPSISELPNLPHAAADNPPPTTVADPAVKAEDPAPATAAEVRALKAEVERLRAGKQAPPKEADPR